MYYWILALGILVALAIGTVLGYWLRDAKVRSRAREAAARRRWQQTQRGAGAENWWPAAGPMAAAAEVEIRLPPQNAGHPRMDG